MENKSVTFTPVAKSVVILANSNWFTFVLSKPEAIFPEAPDLVEWVEINRKYAKEWPVITKQKAPPADAKDFDGVKDKFKNLFDPRPFKGESTK